MKFGQIACVAICALATAGAQDLFLESQDAHCVFPGTCTPPMTKYSKKATVIPRDQWTIEGGFCGALSIQSIALTYGAWISQDLIRKSTPYAGGGFGNPEEGYEVLPQNFEAALKNLRMEANLFGYKTVPEPQSSSYLKWVKKNLAQGYPIVSCVMLKGDDHDAHGLGPFDHIEPIYGLYSNHPLTDEEVYDDDYLVHGSDYAIDGDKNLGYFRKFSSMVDTVKMDGNCKDA